MEDVNPSEILYLFNKEDVSSTIIFSTQTIIHVHEDCIITLLNIDH